MRRGQEEGDDSVSERGECRNSNSSSWVVAVEAAVVGDVVGVVRVVGEYGVDAEKTIGLEGCMREEQVLTDGSQQIHGAERRWRNR